jgi:hypothetical protein
MVRLHSPKSRVILDSPRPRRSAVARLLWPAVLTAAAVVAVVTSGAGDDTRAELEYLQAMHDHVSEISLGSDSLRVVISRLARIERDELVIATDAIREDLDAALELAEGIPPSESLVAVNALFRESAEAWTIGLSGFTSAILAAADDPASTVVVDNIANSLTELRAGDRLYADLVEELEREEVPAPVGPMPAVVMVPADGEILSLSQAYVEAARSVNSGIGLRPGLRISSIVSNPLWRVNPTDQAVMPATGVAIFSVLVTNVGNVASDPVTVQFTLTGDTEPLVLEQQLTALEPGKQTAVIFTDVEVQSGGIYEVVASLPEGIPDTDPDDNAITVVFTVNEDDGG